MGPATFCFAEGEEGGETRFESQRIWYFRGEEEEKEEERMVEFEEGQVNLDWEGGVDIGLGRARVIVVVAVVVAVGDAPLLALGLVVVGSGDDVVKVGETEVVIWDCWVGQAETAMLC